MRGASLGRRLILAVILSQLLMAAGLLAAGEWFTRRELLRAFDTALRGRAATLAASVRYNGQGPGVIFDPALVPPSADHRHPDRFAIWEQIPGRPGMLPVALSQPAPPPMAAGESGFQRLQLQGVPYRGLILRRLPVLDTEEGLRGPLPRLIIYYAAPMLALQRRLTALAIAIAGASLLLLLLACAFAAWAIRRGLRPLHQLARQAEGISVRNWDFQAPEPARATTELAPLAKALERMLAGLQAAFRQQHDFLADAAHELKTPVAILKSSLQTLLQRPRPAEEYRASAASALEDVERLEVLLARMLQLARAEQRADSGAPAQEPVSVAATCDAARGRLLPLARARAVALRLGEEMAELSVAADAEELELVWTNLLENALRHTAAGGWVAIRCRREGGEAVVEVADNGSGIGAEELPRLFERFHRGDSSRARQTGGFGLGLAISKAIIEAYRGRIAVASELGRGTTVTVHLPAAAAAGDAPLGSLRLGAPS
ncbi:MAG: sensor histidine kinase [Terriglobales bacterium]